jgi:hypothetical protein
VRGSAHRIRVAPLLPLLGLLLCPPVVASAPPRVSREELLRAMRAERGYDATRTTNLARFQAGVLLSLVRERGSAAAFLIERGDWYEAYLQAQGLTPDQAPISVRLAWESRQDVLVDPRREQVVRRVLEGKAPRLALNVVNAPPVDALAPARYSYRDTLARPELEITVERVLRYRLLELPDGAVLFDAIEGLRGRPATGALGLLFRLIGQARVVETRLAWAGDGFSVLVGEGRKGFLQRRETVTVAPDGSVERGVPASRADLLALAAHLNEPLRVEYVPWPE